MSLHNRSTLPSWLSALLAIAFVITGILVSVFFFLSLSAFLDRPLNPLAEAAEAVSDLELQPLPQEGLVAAPTIQDDANVAQEIPTTVPLEGDRVHILVMGIDRRPGEPFISRTDSMMLFSIDPSTKSASILSIPRDLYVVIPSRGRDRINTAFVYGSTGNNPAGGARLAMQTIEYNLGVPVEHYVLVDFSAVTYGIDAIGGIEVDVPKEIYDPTFPDMNYGYDPFYVAAGRQNFDGLTALKYARTRHQDSDFQRAARQQQVVLAIRDRVMEMGFSGLLREAPFLYQQINDGIRTDLSLEEIIRIATLASSIPGDQIRNIVLDHNYVTTYQTQQGASVLVPINERIAPLIQELYYGD